jgi:hypothetical protein
MEDLTKYKGREQAYIKHTLLETYLYKLFMILGQHVQTISYVDCFAGPWQNNSDDLSDTSIGILDLFFLRQFSSGHRTVRTIRVSRKRSC